MVPLSPQDRALLGQAFPLGIHWTPQLAKRIGDRPVILGAVLFDGTANDRLNVSDGERETVVGHIYDQLERNQSLSFLAYYPGVGTQSNPLLAISDAITGYTLPHGVERAVDRTLQEIEKARSRQPNADVRLLISGFSRGAAAARHFMNSLEKRWADEGHEGAPPRFYALVFDTVATGQQSNLQLQVPVSADLFYHFVSMDERRTLFPPILDVSLDREPDRIVTIMVPGVHSDVGGSYVSGVGSEYLASIDALLSAMGLLAQQCFSAVVDARAEGKNDSRWMIERMRGIGAPNTVNAPALRKTGFVQATLVPNEYWSKWTARMYELQFTNQLSISRCVNRNEMLMPEFKVTRIGKDFQLASLPPISLPSARIVEENGRHFLTYTLDGTTLSKVEIHKSVLDGVPENRSATLSLGVVRNHVGGTRFWWFLDNVRMWQIDGTFYERENQDPPEAG